MSIVGPTANTKLFAFAVLFLHVKSVAKKHGLGNFSKEVLSHDTVWVWEPTGSSHRKVPLGLCVTCSPNGLAGTCRAKKQFATPIRKDIKRRTKHLGAYCVSYVSKVSVGGISARRDCRSMFRHLLQCCVLRARGDVLAVGAKRASQR